MVYICHSGIDLALGRWYRPPLVVILGIPIGHPSIEPLARMSHTEPLCTSHQPSCTGNSGNMANFYHYTRPLDFAVIYSFYHNMHHYLRCQANRRHTVHRLRRVNCLCFVRTSEIFGFLIKILKLTTR